jgi:hypothetical protein
MDSVGSATVGSAPFKTAFIARAVISGHKAVPDLLYQEGTFGIG